MREQEDDVGASLLALIYENPEDEAARLVYIDHLLERGDPRGEYLHLADRSTRFLNTDGALSPEEHTRMHELRKAHELSWLGPLAAVTNAESRRFFRGFLDACELTLDHHDDLNAVIGRPEWATVSHIERKGKCRASDLVRLIRGTRMPLLRSIGPLDNLSLPDLASDGNASYPIEEISFYVVNAKPSAVFDPTLINALASAPSLPKLKRLFVGFVKQSEAFAASTDVVLSWLFRAPLAKRLEVLGVSLSPHTGLGQWIEILESSSTAIKELHFLPESALGAPALLPITPGEHIHMKREDTSQGFSRLSIVSMSTSWLEGMHKDIAITIAGLRKDALTHADLSAFSPSGYDGANAAYRALAGQERLLEVVVSPRDAYKSDVLMKSGALEKLTAQGVHLTRAAT